MSRQQGIEEVLMAMAAARGEVQDSENFRWHVPRKEDPMSAMAAMDEHEPRGGRLRTWRVFVFGGIGTLYLVSLCVPALRETLARVFAYFPR
jgi:hypothetical protein